MPPKKVAVFHNFMDNIGGAEIVGLTLARELDADFYTTNIDEDKIRKMGFSGVRIKSIGRVPLNAPLRQQAALWKFRRLDLAGRYDLFIIDGDWAMSAAVNNRPNLWYVHSPIREIWDLYGYVREHLVIPFGIPPFDLAAKYAFDLWVMLNRRLNRAYVRHVDHIACNSENTRKRVKRYLRRDAVVIPPPVETSAYRYKEPGAYWLSVSRLITHKRIDIQMEAFRRMPDERLIIVGSYERSRHFMQYAARMKKMRPENVEILSWVDRGRLLDLYAGCRGLITTSKDEDFGMTAVEAMASGKPVIAPDEGGYRETVADGVTGRLIADIDGEKLIRAVKEVGADPGRYRAACVERAKKYDVKVFMAKVRGLIG